MIRNITHVASLNPVFVAIGWDCLYHLRKGYRSYWRSILIVHHRCMLSDHIFLSIGLFDPHSCKTLDLLTRNAGRNLARSQVLHQHLAFTSVLQSHPSCSVLQTAIKPGHPVMASFSFTLVVGHLGLPIPTSWVTLASKEGRNFSLQVVHPRTSWIFRPHFRRLASRTHNLLIVLYRFQDEISPLKLFLSCPSPSRLAYRTPVTMLV